jgi:hypothetical protein
MLSLGAAGLLAPGSVPAATAATSDPPASGPGVTPPSESETAPSSTPSPSDTPDDIAAPTIDSPSDGTVVSGDTLYSGTAEPGSDIQVLASSQTDPLCTVTADGDGNWSCSHAGLDSDPGMVIRVVQLVPGHDDLDATVTVKALAPPTAGPSGSADASNGTVQGTGFPGATVTASVGEVSCDAVVDASGAWFCLLPRTLTSGEYTLSATQTTTWSDGKSSIPSDPIALTIDRDAPAAPAILSPAAGTGLPLFGAVFSGTGEPRATVTVFAGVYSLCQTVVAADGSWTCTAAPVAEGHYPVSALQQDAAGNVGHESGKASFAFSAATPAPTPGSSESPSGTPPGQPSDQPPTGAGAGGSAPPPSDDQAPGSPPPAGAAPDASAPPGGAASATHGTWSEATRFSEGLQPAFGQSGSIDWGLGLAIALAIVGFIAAPARLLAGTVRRVRHGSATTEQIAVVTPSLMGRNRARDEFEKPPEVPLSSWITAGIAFLASAAVTMLGAPVDSQPAYLRLLFAVIVGLTIVNVVATILPAFLGKKFLAPGIEIAFKPKYLLVSAAAALLSRLADLEPALLFGLVFGLALGFRASRAVRGKLAVIQVLCLAALGTVAWLVSGSLPPSEGVVESFLAEVVNTIALSSLGAAGILLLPLGKLSGRAIVRWQPIVWLGLAVGVFTLLGGLLAPSLMGLGGGAGALTLALLAFGFAAISVSAWVWVRFIRPALQ